MAIVRATLRPRPSIRRPSNLPARPLPRPANDNIPIPRPANDNIPALLDRLADLATALPFPKWARPASRLLGYVGIALTALELYKLYREQRDQQAQLAPGPWRILGYCAPMPEAICAGGTGWQNRATGSTICASALRVGCGPPLSTTPTFQPSSTTQRAAFMARRASPGVRDMDIYHIGRSTTGVAYPWQWLAPGAIPRSNLMPNPNLVRDLPGQPVLPVPGQNPQAPPVLDPESPFNNQPEQYPSTPRNWQWSSGTRFQTRPHRREPPRRNQKENKVRNRSATIGQLLFRALDNISEKAEIVDAIYDALPSDVKRRWSKGRDGRGFIDQAGQYGIDGADWKLQALWHNWSKVDVEQAAKNIIKNYIEDKIIGTGQKFLPRNFGNALQRDLGQGKSMSPEQGVSSLVDELFNYLPDVF